MSVVEFINKEDLEVFPTFDSMILRKELLRGVNAYGKNLNPLRIMRHFLKMLNENFQL